MKNTLRIGWIFAGCFLGAGFVSGQELWQFFGHFGIPGIAGLVISIVILMLLGIMIMGIARTAGTSRMDEIVYFGAGKVFEYAVGVFQVVFLFGIVTVTVAGAGELAEMLTGVKPYIASAVMTLIIIAIAITGEEGIAHVFSVCVPLIVLSTVVIAVISQFEFGNVTEKVQTPDNVLLPNWIIASFTYAAYNIFSSVGVIAPFGKETLNRKLAVKGIIFGGAVLLTVSAGILTALSKYQPALTEGLPMLALSMALSPVFGYIYGLMLLCGFLGSSTSSLVAIDHYLSEKYSFFKKRKKLFAVIIGIFAYALSLFGFGNLIGTVYPIFGYVSVVLIIVMTVNYVRLKKKGLTNNKSNI